MIYTAKECCGVAGVEREPAVAVGRNWRMKRRCRCRDDLRMWYGGDSDEDRSGCGFL